MSHLIVLLVSLSICHVIFGFSCPSPNGNYANSDDYRYFYVCSNNCPRLVGCPSPKDYFSNTSQMCASETTDWQPDFDLTGTISSGATTKYMRQTGYKVFLTDDDQSKEKTFLGQYINRTHIIGIQVEPRSANNCILVLNVRLVASGDRAFCHFSSIHPQSALCEAKAEDTFTGCFKY